MENVSEFDVRNIENLKKIVDNIAEHQIQEIGKKTNLTNNSLERHSFNIVETGSSVICADVFKDIDKPIINQEIESLEKSVDNLMKSSILVKDQTVGLLVPLPYDVLKLLLSCTDKKFRQQYFTDVTDYYFSKLSEHSKLLKVQTLSKPAFDLLIKILLPAIKLEVAHQFMQHADTKNQKILNEILPDIRLFLKYPRLNLEDIFVVISNNVGTKNYELYSYEMVPLDERTGHLGDYFKLNILLKLKNEHRTLNLFAKFMTPKAEVWKNFVKSGPSKKEEFFYMVFLPLLEKEGLNHLLDFSPGCYLSRINDVLVLDYMTAQGFITLPLNKKLEFDSLKLVVNKMAKLHSCSIILEDILSKREGKEVTLYNLYQEYIQEVLFIPTGDHAHKDTFASYLKSVVHLATKFPDVTKNYTQEEFKEKIKSGWNLLFEQISKSDKFRNTICHGDMHVGNMLFKFNTEKTCQDVSLVDFQILRYCPPAHDLLFFLYQNTFRETREKYLRELVDYYYQEISKHLTNFDVNVAKKFPKKDFENSLKYMKSQVVIQALMYSQFFMIDTSLRTEIMRNPEITHYYFEKNRNKLVDLGLKSDAYRRDLRGLMEDLVELCETGAI